jgi:hypothetical protein
MNPTNPPTQAPAAAELLANAVVQAAMQQAWTDSLVGDPAARHEEGGWIYMDRTNGQVSIRRAPTSMNNSVDLSNPPVVLGLVIVGTFHTIPIRLPKVGIAVRASTISNRLKYQECRA